MANVIDIHLRQKNPTTKYFFYLKLALIEFIKPNMSLKYISVVALSKETTYVKSY